LSQIQPASFGYADTFRCIGGACEDTCCLGWTVPIDQVTYEKYRDLPPSPLRVLIDSSMVRTEDAPIHGLASTPSAFAVIRMNESMQCPMLLEDRMCRVQIELGPQFLSKICATYPRIVYTLGGVEQKALTLSCIEAARTVLLTPGLFLQTPAIPPTPSLAAPTGIPALLSESNLIQESIVNLVQNRAYPLWQRLFLLGLLCRRLDSVAAGEIQQTVSAFLADFDATIATGALQTAMGTLPFDGTAQMDAVLRLAGLMLHRSNITPRFVECIEAFKVGIGNGTGATLESLTSNYSFAYDHFYAPFFDRYPYILENLLINTIFRCRFPFGRQKPPEGPPAAPPDPPASMAREFALLTAQFALIKGLLIGVAGCHREAFSRTHVVHTVQAASKHFEHHPEFLNMAHALLVETRLDGARGLAILLRNAAPNAPTPSSSEKYVPGLEAGTAV
jgi:lysine-N-methylase